MGEDSKFNNTILTNIGHQMLTSITSGNKKITYTKAEAYTQDVSSITNEVLQGLTSLQGKELSTNLLVSNDNGNVVTITANFENKGLTNNVVFNSIGWFAKLDTDDAERGITANQEYLIGITPANGAQTLVAPPADQSASQAISLNLNMTLSDATNVNMTVSDAGAVHFNQLYDQLAEYTTTSDLTKLLAGKADLGLSYTKSELDAKLLDLSTDTSGKVSANQVQALISDKANISDVYTKSQIDSDLSTRDAQINAKANASDVYTKSQIDSDLSARDTQITNATSLANKAQATANTKANASDVTEISGRLGKLEGTQTLDSPDFNSITASGVYYITNNNTANIKNNPVGTWGVLVVSNGDGHRASQVYYPDDGNSPWCRSLNESNWLPWYQLSTKKDVSNATDLANQAQTTANTKANISDVYTKSQVDSKTSGTVVTAYDIASKTPTKETNSYTSSWLVDQSALGQFADAINDINGTWNRYTHNDGFDLLTLWGQYGIHYCLNTNMTNAPDWFTDKRGTAFVFKFDGNSQTIIYASCLSDGFAYYNKLEGKWHKLATDDDITNLQSTVNNINSTRTPIVTGAGGDDLFAFKTSQIRLYNGIGSTCKNLPPASNTNFFTVQYVFEGPNDNGIAIYRSPANEIWTAGCNGKNYNLGWVRVANSTDISSLQNQIDSDFSTRDKQITNATSLANQAQTTANTKANISDVYTKSQVDSKTSGTVVTAYDIASKTPTKETNSYTSSWLVDQSALGQFADAINDINGTWNRYTHNDGFDLLTLWGQYGIHYCLNTNMTNAPDWFTDKRGTAFVFKFDGNSQTIIYASCLSDGFAYYNKLEGKWHKLATDSDISNLQNQIKANDTGTITTGYDWNTGTPTSQSRTLQNAWLVDQLALRGAVDRMNSIDTNANRLQSTINQQNQTIQSLITRLTNAENEINYIKANYIEGKQFPASQEAQAVAWENANPQRIAFITSN